MACLRGVSERHNQRLWLSFQNEEHRNYVKEINNVTGQSKLKILPRSEVLRNSNLVVKGNVYSSENVPSKNYRLQNPISTPEEYKAQKRLERAREYTYYWLGKEFANNPKNRAFF